MKLLVVLAEVVNEWERILTWERILWFKDISDLGIMKLRIKLGWKGKMCALIASMR